MYSKAPTSVYDYLLKSEKNITNRDIPMQTFVAQRDFAEHDDYEKQRTTTLRNLDLSKIDSTFVEIIKTLNSIPHCFTLQCCSGHFFNARHRLDTVDDCLFERNVSGTTQYTIAYIAVCVQKCMFGQGLIERLKKIASMDPGYIQFGCAQWFWQKTVNSYVLQVEPREYRYKDIISLDYPMAIRVQKARDLFMSELQHLVESLQSHLLLEEHEDAM